MDGAFSSEQALGGAGGLSFAKLRERGLYYADKTRFAWALTFDHKPKLLLRPPRFGKTLLLSTVEEFFRHGLEPYDGHRSYFAGLAIEKLPCAGGRFSVLRLNFKQLTALCGEGRSFEQVLGAALREFAAAAGMTAAHQERRAVEVFERLLKQSSPESLVLLIDDYDAPLIELFSAAPHKTAKEEFAARSFVIRQFFTIVKAYGDRFRCVLITGLTRSAEGAPANNIADISLDPLYAQCCGLTRAELCRNFAPALRAASAARLHKSADQLNAADLDFMQRLTERCCGGWQFALESTEPLFAPGAVLSFLNRCAQSTAEDRLYPALPWFQSSDRLRALLHAVLAGSLTVEAWDLKRIYALERPDPAALLYHLGLLSLVPEQRERPFSLESAAVRKIQLRPPNLLLRRSLRRLLTPKGKAL